MYRFHSNSYLRLARNNRIAIRTIRLFSSCPTNPAANPLIALQAFSNTRENKWLSKTTGISPIEFSPQLQLIRSSEGLDKNSKRPQEKSKQGSKDQSKAASHSHGKHASQAKLKGYVPSNVIEKSKAKLRRRNVIRSVSGVKATRMMGLRLRSDARISLNIGHIILARHEKEKQELQQKILRLETAKKHQEKSMKSMEMSMRQLNDKYARLLNSVTQRRASKSFRDLIFIVLGVGSVTYLCLSWDKNHRFVDEFRRILVTNPWHEKFGTSAEVEKIIFNTMPGQKPLLGRDESANAFVAAAAAVVPNTTTPTAAPAMPVEAKATVNEEQRNASRGLGLFWSRSE